MDLKGTMSVGARWFMLLQQANASFTVLLTLGPSPGCALLLAAMQSYRASEVRVPDLQTSRNLLMLYSHLDA